MSACCVWDLVLSCDKCPDLEQLKVWLRGSCKKWCFQKEQGEGGYIHWQCRFSLKEKERKDGVLKRIKAEWGWENVHGDGLRPTSNENRDNQFYAMKEDTRIEGPWSNENDCYVPRQVREIERLYQWQREIVDKCKVWDSRTINVVIDKKGGNGKSVLCSYMRCYKLGRILPALNDSKDLMRACCSMPTATAYLIDLPRALDKRRMNEMYAALECIKSGYAYDERYNFTEKVFDCPSVWVFTNTEPDMDMLSRDRWRLWEIENLDGWMGHEQRDCVEKRLIPYVPPEEDDF